jgi:hypothetical protein
MSTPELHKSFSVAGVTMGVYHISRVTSDRFWMNDHNSNLVLTDTSGVTIHHLKDMTWNWYGGFHTVNSACELIYINKDLAINKLSLDNEIVTRMLDRTRPWIPRCVYCSPNTGVLMVGMWNTDTKIGKVTHVNTCEHDLTVQKDESDMVYYNPCYIIENRNGDVIVSDYSGYSYNSGAVVVTDCRGRHRFSYTGPSLEPPLRPLGICTDSLSHILVCDENTNSVHLINKDGDFLLFLLTEQNGIKMPRSLDYDEKNHLLLVGSRWTNTVTLYKYLQRRGRLNGKYIPLIFFSALFQLVQESLFRHVMCNIPLEFYYTHVMTSTFMIEEGQNI